MLLLPFVGALAKIWDVRGLMPPFVEAPGVMAGEPVLPAGVGSGLRGRIASKAARRRRLVVPVDLDSPERAEQTRATLWPDSMKDLGPEKQDVAVSGRI